MLLDKTPVKIVSEDIMQILSGISRMPISSKHLIYRVDGEVNGKKLLA